MASVTFNDALWNHETSKDGAAGRYMERLGVRVERAAKRLAPVDTGLLRSSISHDTSGNGDGMHTDIYSHVSYAIYQELGTRYQSGTPFLRPALHQVAG